MTSVYYAQTGLAAVHGGTVNLPYSCSFSNTSAMHYPMGPWPGRGFIDQLIDVFWFSRAGKVRFT